MEVKIILAFFLALNLAQGKFQMNYNILNLSYVFTQKLFV